MTINVLAFKKCFSFCSIFYPEYFGVRYFVALLSTMLTGCVCVCVCMNGRESVRVRARAHLNNISVSSCDDDDDENDDGDDAIITNNSELSNMDVGGCGDIIYHPFSPIPQKTGVSVLHVCI